ncbi:hypothetical protein PSQ40_14855 [Curvibacter sp. HBC61]|uniref:Uncharacterized protein n=1 Tax=Curvibacter cyanobacteriorum TaxID=3026422 RepID=A0ABT5N2G6_9BURK|nr:hypothetical protein [Curvibacter sp. HBC61]MDD0839861.1 hypothetical protein [Curvibacter sp. HBC61]
MYRSVAAHEPDLGVDGVAHSRAEFTAPGGHDGLLPSACFAPRQRL